MPIKEDTVQFTAGVVGGGAGFLLGGPVLGALGAGFLNYVSKKPDVELGGVTLSVSKTALEFYNYLATLNEKYTVLEKAQAALQQSYDKIKDNQSVDLETVEKVEVALANVSEKVRDWCPLRTPTQNDVNCASVFVSPLSSSRSRCCCLSA